jgi:hypothetical protein
LAPALLPASLPALASVEGAVVVEVAAVVVAPASDLG